MEFIDAKIWISKNASLCRVFANRVTYILKTIQPQLNLGLSIVIVSLYNFKMLTTEILLVVG